MPYRVNPLQSIHSATPIQRNKAQKQTPFKEHLKKAQTLKISKHAEQRLHERNIQISEQKWQEIQQKISEAKQKGVKESLVVLKDSTLVVSAKNHTVITALSDAEAKSRIFTNIDGTILLNK